MRPNKFWVILICTILLLSAAFAYFTTRQQGNYARIYQNNILIKTINLSAVITPSDFPIYSENGVNTVTVEPGRVRISEADCPDKSCVRQGWISDGTMPIICLPHRLVIRLGTDATPALDAQVSG